MKNLNLPDKPEAPTGVVSSGIVRRIPVIILCSVAHFTGFFAALTIGKYFWPFLLCAMTGLACIVIGMHCDNPPPAPGERPEATK